MTKFILKPLKKINEFKKEVLSLNKDDQGVKIIKMLGFKILQRLNRMNIKSKEGR